MLKASYSTYRLQFKQPSGTSRGILKHKDTWFIKIVSEGSSGIGECGMFRGLSYDDRPDFVERLHWTCNNINQGLEALLPQLEEFPSIQFGLETVFLSLHAKDYTTLFPSKFTDGAAGIPINGLIWMGTKDFMKKQIKQKISEGFKCIKLKIGAIDFETELGLLKDIRKEYSSEDIELRVDANGAYTPAEALEKLKQLSELNLHSIEQPIKQGQHQEMAKLCEQTPLPIALDEELIGINAVTEKKQLLQTINPQYIILKPTLVGGIKHSTEWINIAHENDCGWWITSALESNVGLNAIAQWTYTLDTSLPQGLGTGALFTNNIDSPLEVKNANLWLDKTKNWNLTKT